MTDERIHQLMKSYVNPETEAFVYEEKKPSRIKKLSVLAAALVLAILGTLVITLLSSGGHSFTLKVSAAGDRLQDAKSGTVYTENYVYDKDGNTIESFYVMEAELLIDGEDIEDVGFRSQRGYGRFLVLHQPDPDDPISMEGWWCDSEGKRDPDYYGWHDTFEYDDDNYSNQGNLYTSNDWDRSYLYHILYTAVDDNDLYLQPADASDARSDVIEFNVTFTDGVTQTKRLKVTYPDGVMTVEEME